MPLLAPGAAGHAAADGLEILLIRHGETAWNAERRLQGQLDIGLNAQGRCQAAALAAAVRQLPLDAIFCSDLQRARQTAQALAEGRGLALQLRANLRERCFGGFEGLLYAQLEDRFPAEYAAWLARDLDAPFPPGAGVGETLRAFSQRALAAVVDCAQSAQVAVARRIAIVSHGGVLEAVYRAVHALGYREPRDFEIPNAALNRLRWDGRRLQIEAWAEVAHLNELTPALDEIEAG